MSVYVDPLAKYPTSIPCFKAGSCHMFADTLHELHAMAAVLGLRRAWFQNDSRLPHYDLTTGKRMRAVVQGVIELTFRESVRKREELGYKLPRVAFYTPDGRLHCPCGRKSPPVRGVVTGPDVMGCGCGRVYKPRAVVEVR